MHASYFESSTFEWTMQLNDVLLHGPVAAFGELIQGRRRLIQIKALRSPDQMEEVFWVSQICLCSFWVSEPPRSNDLTLLASSK